MAAETLSTSGARVYLDEYEPDGNLVESLSFPTAVSGKNKPLLASGTSGTRARRNTDTSIG